MQVISFELVGVVIFAGLLTRTVLGFLQDRDILDIPNERSSHTRPVPRGGGVSIVTTFLAAVLLVWWRGMIAGNLAGAIVGGGLLIAGVGLADDVWSLTIRTRVAIHLVAAIWAVALLSSGNRISYGWLSAAGDAVTMIGLVWMINLYNFMDGIDSLAAIQAVTAAGLAGALFAGQGYIGLAQMSVMLAGSAGGFLLWNWPPAKIFMGDVGSGFLGYVFGVIMIACAKIQPTLVWPLFILMGVFIVDATFTLFRRAIRGDRWYKPHRTHAYQRASQQFRSHAKVSLAVATVNVLWLFPVAFWATLRPQMAAGLAIVAVLPLVWLERHFHAGEINLRN